MRPGDRKNVIYIPGLPTAVPYGQAAQAVQGYVAQPDAPVQTTPAPQGSLPGFGDRPIEVHEPGGDTIRRLLHPGFVITEQFYRTLPDQGWFNPQINPTNPVQFELGSFRVPSNYDFWVFDYEFQVYLQSGLDPYDSVPAEEGRFSSQLGFDIQVGVNKRLSNLYYQLDPKSVSNDRYSSNTSNAAQSSFNAAQSTSAASFASPGSALLPVRKNVQGPRNGVFTLVARPNEQISLQCVIFRRLTTPVAFIQGTFSGYQVQSQVSQALIERMRPR